MHKVKWIIENHIDENTTPLADEVIKQGYDCEIISYNNPFNHNKYCEKDFIVFYGTISLMKQIQAQKPYWVK